MTDVECDGNCAISIVGTKTVRGCASDVSADADYVKTCEANGCNKEIFPNNRLKCLKCTANDGFCKSPTADALYPCQNFLENDFCYTYVISKSLIKKMSTVNFKSFLKQMKHPQSVAACQTSTRMSVYAALWAMTVSNATKSTATLKMGTRRFSARHAPAKTMSHVVIDRCQTKITRGCAYNFSEGKIFAMLMATEPSFLAVA